MAGIAVLAIAAAARRHRRDLGWIMERWLAEYRANHMADFK
jgi:hypothetical protein